VQEPPMAQAVRWLLLLRRENCLRSVCHIFSRPISEFGLSSEQARAADGSVNDWHMTVATWQQK
jgi:hypothetical protein